MQLFDDLGDFGSFDDVVAGDVRDPYTELARIRHAEPVQRLDFSVMPGEEGKPVFMVYRHEDIQQMLKDNETYSSSIIKDFFGIGKHVMVGMDEPEHGRHRALVSKAFSPKALARWETDLVGRVGNDLIDEFAGQGRADLVTEFTFPYPSQVIAGLLGLPQEDYTQFQRWSISLLAVGVNPERAAAATEALGKYLVPILAARREEPRDDLTSGLAEAEIDGEKLSDEEIYSLPALTSARRCRDHVPLPGQPAVRAVVESRPTRRGPRRPLTDSPGDRGSNTVGTPAAFDHPGSHPRHRTCRGTDPCRAHRSCRCLGPPTGTRSATPIPTASTSSASSAHTSLGPWPARLHGNAFGAHGDARRHQSPARPPAQPPPGSRGRRSAHPRTGVSIPDVAAGVVRDVVTELPDTVSIQQ